MVTEREPEGSGQGLGRYEGMDGVEGLVQVLPKMLLDEIPWSLTVAEAWNAIKINIRNNCFMLPPLSI